MYGGRGITVCDEWRTFEGFLVWSLRNGYKEGLSIDRIDNDKGYSPSNCRWATRETQANNKKSNIRIEFNGETHTLSEWSRMLGIKEATIRKRIKSGLSVEEAFNTPIRGGG